MSERPTPSEYDEPDSGIADLEQRFIDKTKAFGRRADDEALLKFWREAFIPHRKAFKRHVEESDARIAKLEATLALVNANQQAVMTFLWGSVEDRQQRRTAGLAKTKEDADRIMRWILCPSWRLIARGLIAVLALIGGVVMGEWVQEILQ